MRFIANSSVLSKKLSHLAGLISANPMQPIISTLLFELKEQKLFITASNMHTTLRVEMEVQEVQEPVDICIPARILIDYLKNLSDQPLSFHVHLDTMSVDITSDSGKYRVGAQDAGEFPKEVGLEDPLQLSVPSEFLQYGLRKTIFAVSKDDVRPAMTGVFFELRNDEMCLVSTDSQRLIQVRNKNISFAQESGFTVPKKPAELLLDLISGSDSTMEVKVDARSVVFYGDQYRLSARLVEMAFPPYRTVIPTENPYTLQINRLEFLHALRRISIFSNKSTNLMVMEIIGNSVRLMGQDLDFSYEGLETLSCQYDGEDMKLAFNSNLTIELLANLSTEEIRIELSSPSRACIFRDSETPEGMEMLMLLMPLKVGV